jgi:ankyrin repeat protein
MNEKAAEEEYEEWVRLRKCDIVAEIKRRASQHEADRLYKEAEFLHRRIVATLKFPIEDVDESLVQGNLHKLVQAEVNMGDFSTAERIQEYLLTKAYRNRIENGAGDLEELAEGFIGLHSLFVARMTGRGKFITLIAKVYVLNCALILDIDALNRLLLQRQFFEVELPHASTILHLAAYKDAVNLGGLLISGGVDVDHQDESGTTPLAGAALWGRERMVCLLLENKVRMDLFNGWGNTALHNACTRFPTSDCADRGERVRLQIVEMLVEGGVNINAKNILAETALSTAIIFYHERLASYLLDMGAWTEIRNDQQKQESRIAAMRTNRESTLPLQMTPGVMLRMQVRANSILHLAVGRGQHSVVRKLIDRGVDVNTIDENRRTALEHAQNKGDAEMMQMLKEAGAVGSSTD